MHITHCPFCDALIEYDSDDLVCRVCGATAHYERVNFPTGLYWKASPSGGGENLAATASSGGGGCYG